MKILTKFGMAESNGVSTPIGREESDEGNKNISEKVPYREEIGSLMYLTSVSRPDIAFAVNKAARNMEDPVFKTGIM